MEINGAMARYTAKEKLRVILRARRILGMMQKQSASDKRIFMSQCIDQLTGEGNDEGDARDICETLWEEGGDFEEF